MLNNRTIIFQCWFKMFKKYNINNQNLNIFNKCNIIKYQFFNIHVPPLYIGAILKRPRYVDYK